MLIKITLQIIVLIFCARFSQAQYFESVGKEAERILISLSEGDSLNHSELTELNDLLSSEIGTEVSESFPGINQKSIDSLKNHLLEFESLAINISVDSAFVLFNDWYLHFQNIFYDYSKEKIFSSPKQKIIFFSTSMSCYCTLKLSRIQTVELLKYVDENSDKYDYWIIDSYWYNELQIKYETLFAPSVIVFNGNNEVLYKIEYDEEMIALLTNFLNNESKAQGF
jgi:hypothetical protein